MSSEEYTSMPSVLLNTSLHLILLCKVHQTTESEWSDSWVNIQNPFFLQRKKIQPLPLKKNKKETKQRQTWTINRGKNNSKEEEIKVWSLLALCDSEGHMQKEAIPGRVVLELVRKKVFLNLKVAELKIYVWGVWEGEVYKTFLQGKRLVVLLKEHVSLGKVSSTIRSAVQKAVTRSIVCQVWAEV